MREVMMKAQALAEAIVESETYKTMHGLEEQVTKDESATALIAAYMEKRQSVELLLRSPEFDAEKVAAAGEELQNAEKAMEECTMVKDMREAQVKFQEMMDNVNRIRAWSSPARWRMRRAAARATVPPVAAAVSNPKINTTKRQGIQWLA